jgi:hypothetical protein
MSPPQDWRDLPLDLIEPNLSQPRRYFDEETLQAGKEGFGSPGVGLLALTPQTRLSGADIKMYEHAFAKLPADTQTTVQTTMVHSSSPKHPTHICSGDCQTRPRYECPSHL